MKKSRIAKLVLALLLSMGLLVSTSTPANAWPNPGSNGCLGGTLRASNAVVHNGAYIGTLRLYQSCGSYYHAYFVSNGVRRSLGVQIWSHNYTHAWRWMSNQYAVWTDMVPGGCVYAQVNVGGQWRGWVSANCGW